VQPATETAIIGTGRVAQALGRALRESGMPVAFVAGRSPGRAAEAALFIGGGPAALSYREAAERAGRVLIAVTDSAIEPVARELALAAGRIRAALHTCGNAGPELLRPLAERGASCGAIHPLQTIHDPEQGAKALRGIAFAISGDADAGRWAEEIATLLGGQVLRIARDSHPLYHAAAVMASNYITALLDAAVDVMSQAGIPSGQALQALAPLARSAVENSSKAGPVQALTGPIARGDIQTVAAHLRALSRCGEPLLTLYRAAGLHAVEVARKQGLPEAAYVSLQTLLRGGE
jgi:predicted short-subunit dehydrogenase-like oxidoreductase (DUF2520 family)